MPSTLPEQGLTGRKIIYDEDGKPYVGSESRRTIYEILITNIIYNSTDVGHATLY